MDEERARKLLLGTLVETPETVIWRHVLNRGGNVLLSTESPPFAAALVQAKDMLAEPTGFGRDTAAIWRLLEQAGGWQCILVDKPYAAEMGRTMAERMKTRVRYIDDVYHVMERPAPVFENDYVRRLTLDDVPLLEAAPADLRPTGFWGDFRACLKEGMAAGAIVDGRVVAIAQAAAIGSRYADVGVYTLESHRRRGLSAACASLVTRWVQANGLTPEWSTGDFNVPSINLARKLGFVEVSRRTYAVLEEYMEEVSRRTYPAPETPR